MDQFQAFVDNHGEVGAQALLDNWERHVGIFSAASIMSLESRWERFLRMTDDAVLSLQTAA